MAAVYVHMRRRANNIRRNRVFRDRDNPLDYLDDEEIIRKYRLSKMTLQGLPKDLTPSLYQYRSW